jgi:hypothetical protein
MRNKLRPAPPPEALRPSFAIARFRQT